MRRQTRSSLCLHCCQKPLHISCQAGAIHWTLHSSASKLRERTRGEGGKSCQNFFFFYLPACCFFFFFIFLCSMGKYNLSVVDTVRHFFPPFIPPAEKGFNINLFACSKRSPKRQFDSAQKWLTLTCQMECVPNLSCISCVCVVKEA